MIVMRVWAIATLLVMAMAFGSDEPDPAAYRADVMRDGGLNHSGEGFCWCASYYANDFLAGYQAFNNAKWIEEAETFYDWFVSKLTKDPDGYEGWIGPWVYDNTRTEDALVGDAVLCEHLAAFAEIVLKDEALKSRFGAKAQKYVDLCTRIMWEKWNKRGCYYQDQAGWGSYHGYGKSIDAQTGKWVNCPDSAANQSNVSDPTNKCCAAAIVLLRLWRITGKPEFRERAERIFGRAKMLFQHYPDEDRLTWNYWVPHGPYDIDGRSPKHWVGVHPKAGYQLAEVRMFAEAYDSGVVFDQRDMERMIRSDLWMAKGDGKNPWRASDGSSPGGVLWSPLARWDETIRKQYEQDLEKKQDTASKINRAFFKNVTCKHLNWDRLYVKDPAQVKVLQPPLQPGRLLVLALPIPDVIETVNAGRARLVTKTVAAGTLKIELLDSAGKEVLGTLASVDVGKDGEFNAPRWDGTNPRTGKKDEGEYRVRWTLNGESRMEPIWVKAGTKHPAPEQAASLAPGQTISTSFEGPLDKCWQVEGAASSTEQLHDGKKSLKLTRGQTAVLRFGAEDDLPVKVTLWVYDNGKKLGKTPKTGGGWGIRDADGDKFCLRTCWRSWLDGDSGYAWFNTGQDQWASPYGTGVMRGNGWVQWVFDFTNPASPQITGAGKLVSNLNPKYTPKGAVAVYLLGGDDEAGPVYIADVTVEYPKK